VNLPELIDAIDTYRAYRDIYIKHVAYTNKCDPKVYQCKHEEDRPCSSDQGMEDETFLWKCEALEDYNKARRELESLGDIKDIL